MTMGITSLTDQEFDDAMSLVDTGCQNIQTALTAALKVLNGTPSVWQGQAADDWAGRFRVWAIALQNLLDAIPSEQQKIRQFLNQQYRHAGASAY